MAGSDLIFNDEKGRIRTRSELPLANDALILVLLKSTGLEADDTLNNYDDLLALLAAANDEGDFTNYARKVINSGISVVVDDTNNRTDIDFADQTYVNAGGATNNTLGKALLCYDPDTTGGTDSEIKPMAAYNITATTDGNNLEVRVNAAGAMRAA